MTAVKATGRQNSSDARVYSLASVPLAEADGLYLHHANSPPAKRDDRIFCRKRSEYARSRATFFLAPNPKKMLIFAFACATVGARFFMSRTA
jgi:hypothetical protein